MKTIAFVQTRFPAPGQLSFSINQHMHADAFIGPTDPNIGKDLSSAEGAERGEPASLRQFQSLRRPLQFRFPDFDFESKQESWINKVFRLRFGRGQGSLR